jgi:hypothetical protein
MATGEVTRHLGRYGSFRLRKAVLPGAIPPLLLKTDDNPEGWVQVLAGCLARWPAGTDPHPKNDD